MGYLDIVNEFDLVEDVIVQPDGLSIRVRGKKDGDFHDFYKTYQNKKTARCVFEKIKMFVGIPR